MNGPDGTPVMPPHAIAMQMLLGKFVSKAMSVAAQFGFADALADGPHTAETIALRCHTNPDATWRLLRALAAVGVFEKTGPRSFGNNAVSSTLRKDLPGSMHAMAVWLNCPTGWDAWGELGTSVKTGGSAAEVLWGGDVFHAMMNQRPDDFAIFNDAMTGFSAIVAGAVVAAYPFEGVSHIVDIGGGHGGLLAAILAAHPNMQGVLFDLPGVVAGAGHAFDVAGVAGRVQKVGGDFRESVPVGADTYIMKHIIHDWDDATCIELLRACRNAMSRGGRVLVVDQVVTDGPESTPAKLLDLEMLVMTPGGRERSADDFEVLFEAAGLELVRIVPTQSPVCVIEARAA